MRDDGKMGIVVAYEAYKGSEELDCGTPVLGRDGIVISSFAGESLNARLAR